MRRLLRRSTLALALLPALAACGDDGPSTPRLTADQVAGQYASCALTFTPDGGTIAPVDIRDAVFELGNPTFVPRIAVDANRTFALQYYQKGTTRLGEQVGTYSLSTNSLQATFTDANKAKTELLLPQRVTLNYTASPKRLTIASGETYTVTRADYARLKGVAETNLPSTISGSLSGSFQVGGCF